MADCEGVESYVAATAIFGAVFGTACRSETMEERNTQVGERFGDNVERVRLLNLGKRGW